MNQQDKELLLKDLCARVPYGVRVFVDEYALKRSSYVWEKYDWHGEPHEVDGVSRYGVQLCRMEADDGFIDFDFIKPYLLPMSSMTEEQRKDFESTMVKDGILSVWTISTYEWLNQHKCDYRGLIPKGIALDATGLNIY